MSERPTTLAQVRHHPLMWPPERARTSPPNRKAGRWTGNFDVQIKDLELETDRSKIHDWTLSMDKAPYSSADPRDPGVALWFNQNVKGQWILSVLACDRFRDYRHNIRAISLTIQRLRLIEDYGCYTAQEAMRGAAYAALPPPDAMKPKRPWWQVLGVAQDAEKSIIEVVYRTLAKSRHPDAGGSVEMFQELQEAYREALKG